MWEWEWDRAIKTDPELHQFLDTSEIVEPLRPRDAFLVVAQTWSNYNTKLPQARRSNTST